MGLYDNYKRKEKLRKERHLHQITVLCPSLLRVPEDERSALVRKASFNIFFLLSICIVLITFFFCLNDFLVDFPFKEMPPAGTPSERKAILYDNIFFIKQIICLPVLLLPIIVFRWVINRIVNRKYPKSPNNGFGF